MINSIITPPTKMLPEPNYVVPLYPTPLSRCQVSHRSPTDVSINLPCQLSYLYSSTLSEKEKHLGLQNLPNCSFLFMLTLHLFLNIWILEAL